MKLKTSLAVAFTVLGCLVLKSQVILSQDFSNYDGSVSSIPNGWYISWNSTSSPSFYSTTSYSGQSAPAYKFGVDNATIITPAFANADSLSFWIRSSTTYSVDNTLEICESADSITWTVLTSIDSLPTTGKTHKLGVTPTTSYLRFRYTKVSGNLAFDDILISKNEPVKVKEFDSDSYSDPISFCYPNPSEGCVNIFSPSIEFPVFLKIYNEAGTLVTQEFLVSSQSPDISHLKNGTYFLEIVTQKIKLSQRLIILK